MKNIESAVARHYGGADLLARIFSGLDAAGADRNRLRPEDIAPVDEFHIGGREATTRVVAKMSLAADQHVLDIGCGLGGAARYIAAQFGCKVSGIDLTPEYISVAKTLTELTGLQDKASFEVGEVEDRTDFAVNFFKQRLAAAEGGPPPLGIHLAMGADAPAKLKNVLVNIEAGRIAPVQMIASRKTN